MNKGTISQIIGVVVDVHFPETLPEIYSALEVKKGEGQTMMLEVEQHLGAHMVRTIAMSTTDGLARGVEEIDTRKPNFFPIRPQNP